jgi:ArsR family transcriptional regulator
MDHDEFERVAKALADPRRFGILEAVANQSQETCGRTLCRCLPIAQPTVSHHLKELINAGLVEARREGQYIFYAARAETLERYMDELRRRVLAGIPAA